MFACYKNETFLSKEISFPNEHLTRTDKSGSNVLCKKRNHTLNGEGLPTGKFMKLFKLNVRKFEFSRCSMTIIWHSGYFRR